ncbi:MAG: sensor histidine kinase [Candidatus Nanopelagicales bacterium]
MEAIAGLALGILLGAFLGYWYLTRERYETIPDSHTAVQQSDLDKLLQVLPGVVIKLDGNYQAIFSSELAQNLGLVVNTRIKAPQLAEAIRNTRLDQRSQNLQITISQNLGKTQTTLEVSIIPLNQTETLVFGQDLSLLRRVEAVRRDFVANISHELKTPVGALSLLAEAISSAEDDVEAIKKFAGKITIETERLANVIRDIIDLSQVQADEPLAKARNVIVDKMILEAIDSVKIAAESKKITISHVKSEGINVMGVEKQIVAAIRNLLTNAIAYSPEKSQITVGTTRKQGVVEVTVTDQGIGIPIADQSRVFERFFRVDQARSRDTGGSGLGLSIVKHVCENHGGEVSLWSVPGEGSTFTMRFPDRASAETESKKVKEVL